MDYIIFNGAAWKVNFHMSKKKNRIALNVFACKPPDMKMLGTASTVTMRKNDMGWNGS